MIFDAPEPWGPWSTVTIIARLNGLDNTWSFHFAPKWWRNGGPDFTLVFTSNDSWNTVDERFVLNNEGGM